MDDVLLLVHRIPYPPDKGDKIRSWRLLEFLAERFNVHLGCFIDDPDDWAYTEFLEKKCASTHFEALNPLLARARSLTGLVSGAPLTMPYYKSAAMRRWVDAVRAQPLAAEFVYSSAMAPYLEPAAPGRPRIIDFVDADSEKWRKYAERKSFPMSYVYRREAERLGAAEVAISQNVDVSLFVSEAEARLLAARAGAPRDKIDWVSNGVDTDFFNPDAAFQSVAGDAGPKVVFTGAMDYWANVDAVVWFAEEVLGALRRRHPALQFYIVGARPAAEVTALAARPGVIVTGRVPDVRPYIAASDIAVAPMRIAQGIQNKVLEAMAMARPVIATPDGALGLEASAGVHLEVASDGPAFADAVLDLLDDPDQRERLGRNARALMEGSYSWSAKLQRLESALRRLGLFHETSSAA
ncbi:MAG: TIGR03087 family PEP-CTERM/XrtA system glycosyltransferase [Pseudomonadota bacterium]